MNLYSYMKRQQDVLYSISGQKMYYTYVGYQSITEMKVPNLGNDHGTMVLC